MSILLSQGTYSQSLDESLKNPMSAIQLHILVAGILLEQQISDISTIVLDFGAGFAFHFSEIIGVRKSNLFFNPYYRIAPGIYTNRKTHIN